MELDDFITEDDVLEATIRDPEDLHEAQQRYGIYELKNLVRVLERLQDSSNSTSIQSLCRRVKMTEAELRKHSEEYEIFRDGAGAKKTYMEVREQLRLRELSKLKESMLVEMRKFNKPIRYRRENVLHL